MAIKLSFFPPQISFVSDEDPKRGIILMLIGVFVFSIMNLLVKHVGVTYSPIQLAFFRNIFALIPVMIMVMTTTGVKGLSTGRWKMHLFRGTAGTISILFFFNSFRLLPLADAVAFNFAGPLFVALFSALFLKESLGLVRCLTLLGGFGGVIVMVQPWAGSEAVNWMGAANGLGNAFFYGLSIIGVRSLGRTESHATIVFYFTAISSVYMSFVVPFSWQAPEWNDFYLMIIIGVLAGIGQLFVTRAFQYASASVISPFSYVGIIWAILFGYFIWGEIPSWAIFAGAAGVIGASLFLFLHETKKKKIRAVSERDVKAIEPEA